jgi:hypothetical protein
LTAAYFVVFSLWTLLVLALPIALLGGGVRLLRRGNERADLGLGGLAVVEAAPSRCRSEHVVWHSP